MTRSSMSELREAALGAYVEEVREFLTSRHLAHGQPQDLQAFTERLRVDESFREETTSIARSILYREDTGLAAHELQGILAVAAGGQQVSDTRGDSDGPLRELSAFVSGVVHSMRSVLPQEIEPEPSEAAVEKSIPSTEVAASLANIQPSRPSAPGQPLSGFTTPQPLQQSQPSLADALWKAAERAPASSSEYADEGRSTSGEPRVALATQPRPGRHPWAVHTFLQRWYWLPGAFLLLLAIGVSWRLMPRAPVLFPSRATQTASAPPLTDSSAPISRAQDGGSRTHQDFGAEQRATGPTQRPEVPAASSQVRPGSPAAQTAPRGIRTTHPTYTEQPHSSGRSANLAGSPATRSVTGSREGVFLASSGAMAAHLQFAPAPAYPKLASFARVQGEVIVQVVVGRNGAVEATRVLDGPHLLRSAAEHAIRRWRYKPYVVDGRPTDVATIVTVTFRLRH